MKIEFIIRWTHDVYEGYDSNGKPLYTPVPQEHRTIDLLDALKYIEVLKERRAREISSSGLSYTRNIEVNAEVVP